MGRDPLRGALRPTEASSGSRVLDLAQELPQSAHELLAGRSRIIRKGYLVKDLTPREREVFHLVIEGCTTKEVAVPLGIHVKTADNHRYRMMSKLGVHNTAELVGYAARRRLLP